MSIAGGFQTNYLSQLQESSPLAYGGSNNYLSSLGMSNMLGNMQSSFAAPSINMNFTPPTITIPPLSQLQTDIQEYPQTIGSLGGTNPSFDASFSGALGSYYNPYGELGLLSEMGSYSPYSAMSMNPFMTGDPFNSQMTQDAMSGLCAGLCTCGD